jgi:lipopolysaccharide/colanic/teichoic acid biosynthesis glycosyltransferase
MYKHFLKRLFDLIFSFSALLILSPFLLIITVVLHFANKGAGVFFTQNRPGKDAKLFK